MSHHPGRRRLAVCAAAVTGCASLLSALALAGATPGLAATGQPLARAAQHDATGNGCHLGNGVKHVVEIGFDNVHYFRDNPNVPSDLQMMPNLLHFFTGNGTFLSNSHTPLIAHTADDLLTTVTGLYGDRAGMPVSNSYQAYNTDGTTDPAGSFAYWTDPIFDTAKTPNAGHDTNPSMVYSATPPATTSPAPAPNTITPAPWVPFTRAGCDVGDVSTVNQVLENTAVDIPKVFGASSPEAQQLAADPDSFKDAETADYVGLGVHCARGSAFCADAQGVKYGQTTPSHTAVPDVLPGEPGGYTGYQGLFGHRYVAPQLGAGTPNLTEHGYQVTNAAGNLVNLNGNQINGAFLTNHPGFPGFGPINASQTLAYMADLLEKGVPVVNGYIADIHGNENIPGLSACASAPAALGSGDPCYVAQAQYYNQAFGTFFKRLAAAGITPKNTLFVLSSDEGDHEAGANVGRAVQPSPASCDGATVSGGTVTPDVPCSYPAGTFGELDANVTGLLSGQQHNTVPFSLENDTAPEFYVTGNPGPDDPSVRSLEHGVAEHHRGQPVHRDHPEDRQLHRRPGRGSHPAHGERRPGPDADVRHVRQTRLLPAVLGPDRELRREAGVPEHRLRLGSRRLCRGDQHQLRRVRRARGQAARAGRADRQPGAELGRGQQRPDRRVRPAPARAVGGRDRHPADADVPDRAA